MYYTNRILMKTIFMYMQLVCLTSYALAVLPQNNNQNPQADLTQYPITREVITALFSAQKTEKTATSISVTTADAVCIQLYLDTHNNDTSQEIVTLAVSFIPKESEDIAPWQRKNLGSLNANIIKAYTAALEKEASMFDRLKWKLTGQISQELLEKKRWIDDAMCGQFKYSCRGTMYSMDCKIRVPRIIFEIIKAEATVNVAQNTYTKITPDIILQNKTVEVSSQQKTPASEVAAQFEKLRSNRMATPEQAGVCDTFIKQLIQSKQYTIQEDGNNVMVLFKTKRSSPKLQDYTLKRMADDMKKYGAHTIPPHILDLCKDDAECLATWFMIWNLKHNKDNPALDTMTGQYYLEHDREIFIKLNPPKLGGYHGSVSMPREQFENIKEIVDQPKKESI